MLCMHYVCFSSNWVSLLIMYNVKLIIITHFDECFEMKKFKYLIAHAYIFLKYLRLDLKAWKNIFNVGVLLWCPDVFIKCFTMSLNLQAFNLFQCKHAIDCSRYKLQITHVVLYANSISCFAWNWVSVIYILLSFKIQ